MAIEEDIIKRVKGFGKWVNHEIGNSKIFCCNPVVHHKDSTIEINKGKMRIHITGKGFYLMEGSTCISYGIKLEQVLLDGLQSAIKNHYVNSYIE